MTAANVNRAAAATKFTGITFTALAIPLALFGAKPLDLSLAGTTIRGQLDDYAVEYLGAAAVASLGLGLSRLGKGASTAQTSSKSSHPMPLQAPQSTSLPSSPVLTEETLRASGLHVFLDDDSAPLIAQGQSGPEKPAVPATQPNSVAQSLPKAGASASDANGPYGAASQHPPVTAALSPVSHPQAPVSQPQAPVAASMSASGPGFVAAAPDVSAATQASVAVQSPAVVNQPSQPPAQVTPSTDLAISSLANIVAEVQSIVGQLSVQAQHSDTAPVEAPQPVVPAPSQPPVQVATLPLGRASTAYHQMNGYQLNGNPAKGYPTNGYRASSHEVNRGLDAPTLPAAQAYVGFASPQAAVAPHSTHRFSAELAALEQVYQVREEMQQLMGQLDLMQASLEQTIYPTQSLVPLRVAPTAPSYTVSAMEPTRAAVA